MRARLEKLCGDEVARALWVGTFHATCAKLLRAHGEAVGVQPNFVIYDAADQKAVVARVLKELELDERRYPPRAVLAHIHKHKQEGRGPDEVASHSYVDDVALKIFRDVRGAPARGQRRRLRRPSSASSRWRGSSRAREEGDRIRRRFDYVLVDEFQDTNATQYRFLREPGERPPEPLRRRRRRPEHLPLARRRRAQHPRLPQRLPRRDGRQARAELPLQQAHRRARRSASSRAPSEREPKELWTANDDGRADPRRRGARRARRGRLRRRRGHAQGPRRRGRDHARSPSSTASTRSRACSKRRSGRRTSPTRSSAGTKFYERAEIKDALAYLRVLVNPRSDVDLLRIINVARARHRADDDRSADGLGHGQRAARSSTRCARADEIEDLGEAAKKKLAAVPRAPRRACAAGSSASAARACSSTRCSSAPATPKTLEEEDSAEADARVENLRELVGSIHDYEAEAEAAGAEPRRSTGFLERVTLVRATSTRCRRARR